ncbi:hypothetical protein [Thiobacillus sedimenti]|uniref:Uncharacterized protein n=1 Tax=Thiobacillus sedimenti TaxID=3110231 RepID=A0ABZ1CM88_9PROT|nr:hypothetical protein [Thiobacillus sp. SCUT-2]WRS40386.1 hypothetical protein VA613_05810 [Thiobacillus sp. SCUT-2]
MSKAIWFGMLPLLCGAGVAMAQAEAQGGAPAAEEAAAPPQVSPAGQHVSRHAVRRQGQDMRRCLKLGTNAAIIRCAEPGRKP